ncbi:MAG: hypothetical protein ABIQ12_02865, partial [Opitutaceae bacterium]
RQPISLVSLLAPRAALCGHFSRCTIIAGLALVPPPTAADCPKVTQELLAAFGVPGTLFDPKVELYSGAGVNLTENDNWLVSLTSTFTSVGAFGLQAGSRDAALLATLPPGAYSVQVKGADGGTGEALVEIYEVP